VVHASEETQIKNRRNLLEKDGKTEEETQEYHIMIIRAAR
jgi:hypothetical protein